MLAAAEAVGAHELERFTHETTMATNALLERRNGVRGRIRPESELEPLDLDSLPDLDDAEAIAVSCSSPSATRVTSEQS